MRRRALALSARIQGRGLIGRQAPQVFVTHAPPFGLGDREDHAHVGFETFLGLIDRHKPSMWLHGHVHLYGPELPRVTSRGETKVVNVFGHRILEV
jgi:Icc-related predicted phosphoesterase